VGWLLLHEHTTAPASFEGLTIDLSTFFLGTQASDCSCICVYVVCSCVYVCCVCFVCVCVCRPVVGVSTQVRSCTSTI